MRISNMQFAKGSIIYARFPESLDFLNGRPLVVVSDHIPVYDCVWVVRCGTRGKAGINISLFNYSTRQFVGGQEITTVYPSSIYTVRVSQIISTIGILDRRIMKKLDEAIDFFLGRHDNVPEFLKNYEDELTSVTFQPALAPYTQVNENPGSEYLHTHSHTVYPVQQPDGTNTWNLPGDEPAYQGFPAEDPQGSGVQAGMTRKVPRKSAGKRAVEINEDKVAEFLTLKCSLGAGKQTTVKELTEAYNKWAETNVTVIMFSKVLNSYLTGIDSKAKRVRCGDRMVFEGIAIDEETGTNPNPELAPVDYSLFDSRDSEAVRSWAVANRSLLPKFETNFSSIMNIIGSDSAIMILSRQASLGAIQIKYGMTTEEAEDLRANLHKLAQTVGNNLISKVMRNVVNEDNVNEFEKVCIVIACKLYGFGNSPKVRVKLNRLLQTTMKKYLIDFSEKTVWSDVVV